MKSLCDVLPMGAETVILRESLPEDDQIKVDVKGIDVEHFGALFANFPEIYDVINGKADKFDAAALATSLSGRALTVLIAAGAGVLGNPKAEAGIANLALFDRIKLLAPILKRTMPDGPGPFVDLMRAVGIKIAPNNPASTDDKSANSDKPTIGEAA